MRRHVSIRRLPVALLFGSLLLIALQHAVAAHAELADSRPADGETVEGTPPSIRADFTEDLASGSEMALLDAGGATIATGGVDPANPARMRIDPPELEPGDYEVEWKAFADDGHLETGTFTFTVSAPITPPPSLAPTPSSTVTAQPSAAVAPPPSVPNSPSPTASAPTPPANAASTGDVLLPIIAAVVLVAVLGGYLLMRRRPSRP